jgi:hypothetical protein
MSDYEDVADLQRRLYGMDMTNQGAAVGAGGANVGNSTYDDIPHANGRDSSSNYDDIPQAPVYGGAASYDDIPQGAANQRPYASSAYDDVPSQPANAQKHYDDVR